MLTRAGFELITVDFSILLWLMQGSNYEFKSASLKCSAIIREQETTVIANA